ncbi:hypothetical protein ACFLZQ_04600 [Thermodesulfobacteriota bacterium]
MKLAFSNTMEPSWNSTWSVQIGGCTYFQLGSARIKYATERVFGGNCDHGETMTEPSGTSPKRRNQSFTRGISVVGLRSMFGAFVKSHNAGTLPVPSSKSPLGIPA